MMRLTSEDCARARACSEEIARRRAQPAGAVGGDLVAGHTVDAAGDVRARLDDRIFDAGWDGLSPSLAEWARLPVAEKLRRALDARRALRRAAGGRR